MTNQTYMELTYNFKNKFLLVGGIVISGVVALLLAQLVFADSTSSLLPSSGGAYLQWTPSTGTTHYTLVDESTCNGTTDYDSTNSVGNRDSYGVSLASVPNGSTITAIEITPCASRNKTGGGSGTMNVFYRYSGVDSADVGNYALTGTTPTQLTATTFSGLSLVKGSASTLQIGAVLSAGNRGARLSRVATVVTYTPLSVPSNLSAATVSQTSIDLSWTDNATNEDGFKVERSNIGSSGPFSEIASTTANAVSYSNTGLIAAAIYWYRVRAFNVGGDSSYSNVASSTTLANPPTVTTNAETNITATSSTLNGSANPNGAVATGWFRYATTSPGACDDVFGIRTPASGGTNLGSGTSSIAYSRSVSGLSSGVTYYYCAIASNNGGTGYGTVVSFTTIPPAPAAPSNLGATNVSGSQNYLSWTDNSLNEDGFKVERSLNSQFGPFSQIATTSASVVSYSDTGLATDQTYYYRVRAFNAGGDSGYTNTAYVITATVVPSDPSNLTATASSSSAILNWTQNSTNEEGFKVERGTDGVNFAGIATKGINATSHVDLGLASGAYYYRVRAFNVIGNSGYSNTASTTIP